MTNRDEGGGLLSAAASGIDLIGLRRSRIGRRIIAGLNVVGERGVRLLYLRRKTSLVVDGHKMFLSGEHAPSLGFVSSMVHDRYEPEMKDLLKSLLREGMTVFDVGAHVGYYTLMAARLVGPAGRVYAFEAEPENFQLLRRNVELNHYTNVTCVPKAISDRTGVLAFYVSRQGNDRHTLIDGGRAVSLSERSEVPTITLDEFWESVGRPQVDVIKMDIEGAEPLAVSGMAKLLSRSDALSFVMEFAPEILRAGGTDPAEFLGILRRVGFDLAPVERDLPGNALEPGKVPQWMPEIDKRGAINVICRKHPVPAPLALGS